MSAAPPTIRSARAEEEAALVGLWRECGLVASHNDPGEDFRFARGGPASDVLVAQDGAGAILAGIMVGHDGHRGWLYYVAVSPALRGSGLGRRMVEAAEAWLRERGVWKAQLMVRETNRGVVSFYERLGYETAPRVVLGKGLRG